MLVGGGGRERNHVSLLRTQGNGRRSFRSGRRPGRCGCGPGLERGVLEGGDRGLGARCVRSVDLGSVGWRGTDHARRLRFDLFPRRGFDLGSGVLRPGGSGRRCIRTCGPGQRARRRGNDLVRRIGRGGWLGGPCRRARGGVGIAVRPGADLGRLEGCRAAPTPGVSTPGVSTPGVSTGVSTPGVSLGTPGASTRAPLGASPLGASTPTASTPTASPLGASPPTASTPAAGGGSRRAGPPGGAQSWNPAGRGAVSRRAAGGAAPAGPPGAAHALGWAWASAEALPRAARSETMRSTSAFPEASRRTKRRVMPGRSPEVLERTTTPSPRSSELPSASTRSKRSCAPTGLGARVARKNPSRPTWAPYWSTNSSSLRKGSRTRSGVGADMGEAQRCPGFASFPSLRV